MKPINECSHPLRDLKILEFDELQEGVVRARCPHCGKEGLAQVIPYRGEVADIEDFFDYPETPIAKWSRR